MRLPARTFAIGLILSVTTFGLGTAHAQLAEGCSIDAGSADTPHAIDPTGDYDGVVFGNESGIHPLADVYGDGIDLERAWFSRDAEGNYTIDIRVVDLSGLETNAVFYVLWTFEGEDGPATKRRYLSAQTRPWANTFRYGYLDASGAVGSFTSQGATTGTVHLGGGGGFTIDVPMDAMGDPGPGDELTELAVEARILVGSPGHGQDDVPAAGPAGLVAIVDDLTNAQFCHSIVIPSEGEQEPGE